MHFTREIAKVARFAQQAWITANERWLRINTADKTQYEEPPGWWRGQPNANARNQDNRAYGTPDYFYVRKIIKRIAPSPEDVIYDIGSGKGRILCMMSRMKVAKCVGIELFEEFCDVARVNAAKVRGKRSPIEIRCEDAARADYGDGSVYFLFNPFGGNTLQEVLSNIERSLAEKPRRVRLIYYNSVHRNLVDACGWLKHDDHFKTFNGLHVDFYRSRG